MKSKKASLHKSDGVRSVSMFSIIKQGLVLALPFIMVGSLILILRNFPVEAYQQALNAAWNGKLEELLVQIYNATLGILSFVLLATISYSYAKAKAKDKERSIVYPILAICCYLTFIKWGETPSLTTLFGPECIFTAIVISLGSSSLFRLVSSKGKNVFKQYSPGSDTDFNMITGVILPVIIVIAIFAVLRIVLIAAFGDVDIQRFGSDLIERIFKNFGANIGSAVLLVLTIQILWFLGMHGSNMVDEAVYNIFQSGMQTNQDLMAAGAAPTEIFTKTFLDSFVFMGGCGTAICLVIAILVVSRTKHNRKLAKFGFLPVLFNINEFIIYGLPVVFNVYLLVPFLLTPVVLTLVSGLAVMSGLVPISTNTVDWTSPALLSGYAATGSFAGSVLQAVNIAIGVLIYIPFIKRMERKQSETLKQDVKELTKMVMNDEETGKVGLLLEDKGALAPVARMLVLDLRYALEHGELEMFYQPQVCYDGTVYGIEALLRWNYPGVGYLYPPLIIQLAQEDNLLDELDLWIFEQTCKVAQTIAQKYQSAMEVSVNMLPMQLEKDVFFEKIKAIYKNYDLKNIRFAIEITEKMALNMAQSMLDRLDELGELGIGIIMDDFGMGHSSMVYLQNNKICAIKLDKQLTQHLSHNERAHKIVYSVNKLSKKLGVRILAEYVETAEQKEKLYELGCTIYQGYLYSKAVSFEELERFFKKYNMCTKENKEE